MRKRTNKYMKATQRVSLACKGYVRHTLRKEKDWERTA